MLSELSNRNDIACHPAQKFFTDFWISTNKVDILSDTILHQLHFIVFSCITNHGLGTKCNIFLRQLVCFPYHMSTASLMHQC